MSKCRHCGNEQNTPRIRIGIRVGRNTSYFYYPDDSCINDGDGMKLMIRHIDEKRKSKKEYSMSLEEEKEDRFVECTTSEEEEKE